MAISEPGDPPVVSRVEPGSASGKVESIVGAQRLLTINTGSSSLKAALYRLREDTTETLELRAEASRIGGGGGGEGVAGGGDGIGGGGGGRGGGGRVAGGWGAGRGGGGGGGAGGLPR